MAQHWEIKIKGETHVPHAHTHTRGTEFEFRILVQVIDKFYI